MILNTNSIPPENVLIDCGGWDNLHCPMCNSALELNQINLNYAVYVCPDLKCSYPVNHSDCIIVKRRLKDINKPLGVLKQEWKLKNIKETMKQPNSSNSIANCPSINSDTDFPMAEIDDLLNSIDNCEQNLNKPSSSQDYNTDDFSYFNLQSILSRDNEVTVKQAVELTKPKSGEMHSLGEKFNIVPMSDSQYQNLDNFLLDLLK